MAATFASAAIVLEDARQTFSKLTKSHPIVRDDYRPTDFNVRLNALVARLKELASATAIQPLGLASPEVVKLAADKLLAHLKANPLSANTQSEQVEQVGKLIGEVEQFVLGVVPPPISLNDEISQIVQQLADLDDPTARLALVEPLVTKILAKVATIDTALDRSIQNANAIVGHEQKANTAAQNAQTSAITAATEEKATLAVAKELKDAIALKNDLLPQINGLKTQAMALLADANKVGLAGSFQARRVSLSSALTGWRILFGLGIAALMVFGLLEFKEIVAALNSPQTSQVLNGILARALVASPIVWGTWFAAKQYGHTRRLMEDYAFKEAAALAYVGYKSEMEKDEDTLKLLRTTAVRTFGENPIRILLGRLDHASPVAEVLGKLDPNVLLERVSELVQKLGEALATLKRTP